MKRRWTVVAAAVLCVAGWMGGCGDDSDDDGTGPADSPPSPVALTVDSLADSAASIRWTANHDSDFARYVVWYDTVCLSDTLDAALLDDSRLPEVPSAGDTTLVLSGLLPGTQYWFRVYVEDRSGLSTVSNLASGRTSYGPPDTLGSLGAVEPGWWWIEEVRDTLRSGGLDANGQPFAYQTYANHTVRCSVTVRYQNADTLFLTLARTDTLWAATGGVDSVGTATTYTLQKTGQGVYAPAVLPVYQDLNVQEAFYPWCALPLTVGTTWPTVDTVIDTTVRWPYPMVGTVRVRITGALDGHGIGTGMVGRTFAGATRACIVKTTLDTGRVVVIADSAIAVGPLPIADPDDTLRAFTYRGSMEEHVWADLPASLWRRNVIARSDTTMVMVPAVVHDTTISVATLKVFCTVGDTLTE